MRVALVSPYSWSVPGGVNEHVGNLAARLEDMGHEAWILAPSGRVARRTEERLPNRFISCGSALAVHSNGSKAHVNTWPLMLQRMERILDEHQFELVHAHEPCTPSVAASAVLSASVPVVGTFHRSGGSTLGFRMFLPLARKVVERLAVRICVSPFARDFAAQLFPGDYRIIPNGVNIAEYRPARDIPKVPGRVLFIGRPDTRKGLPVLLHAFTLVKEMVPQATLVVVGSTDDDLESAAGKAPLKLPWPLPGVQALGRVPLEEKVAQMGQAQVLAVPSLGGESFGIVLAEGLAAGLPVVASDLEPYRAVLRDGELGMLVPPGDPYVLRDAIAEILTAPKGGAATAARGIEAVEGFAWSVIADAILGAYRDALDAAVFRGATGTALASERAAELSATKPSRWARVSDHGS